MDKMSLDSGVVIMLDFCVVQVSSMDTTLITVREGHLVDPQSTDGVFQFPVELQIAVMLWKGAPEFINVEVKCTITGQSHIVPVRILKSSNTGA